LAEPYAHVMDSAVINEGNRRGIPRAPRCPVHRRIRTITRSCI